MGVSKNGAAPKSKRSASVSAISKNGDFGILAQSWTSPMFVDKTGEIGVSDRRFFPKRKVLWVIRCRKCCNHVIKLGYPMFLEMRILHWMDCSFSSKKPLKASFVNYPLVLTNSLLLNMAH